MNTSVSRSIYTALGLVAMATLAACQSGDAGDAKLDADKARAEANYDVAKENCESLSGNQKDVCEEQAKANKEKAQAGAKAEYEGDRESHNEARLDAAKADYEVAKARCDALGGNAKDVCLKEAEAALTAAKARADLGEAKIEASKHVTQAEYEAMKQRCDSLTGSAKDACVAEAKTYRVN